MKIAFFDSGTVEKEYLNKKLSAILPDAELFFYGEPLSPARKPERTDFDAISVFTGSVLVRGVIEKFPQLKLIAARSTGFDHIDLATAKDLGITVSYAPSYGEKTVAEFAFALLLALSRKIILAANRVSGGRFSYEGFQGFDLHGKTLGVVGTGRIGKNSIRIAKGFGMSVVAFDAEPDHGIARELGFTYGSFEKVLGQSDIVTLHVPYLKGTHHLMDKTAFGFMKRGAFLINTSRGAVVDTEALAQALETGRIGGAGLDVLEEENALREFYAGKEISGGEGAKRILELNQKIIKMENVIVTPHMAFNTREAVQRIWDATVENIQSFFIGKPINIAQ